MRKSNKMQPVLSFVGKFFGMILAILAPVKGTMIAAGVLIIIDMLTGIWRAKKSGEPITSNGFRRTLSKMAAYQLAIVTGFIMEKYLGLDFIPIVKVIGGLIALTEGKSALENISAITGVDFWKALLEKLQGKKEIEKQ